jgi:hypothetical protein
MLTKYERELERQAGVVSVRTPQRYDLAELPVGSYMWKYTVINHLNDDMRCNLAQTISNRCDVYVNGGIEFIQTSQLKTLMGVDMLRKLECGIPTILIPSK